MEIAGEFARLTLIGNVCLCLATDRPSHAKLPEMVNTVRSIT